MLQDQEQLIFVLMKPLKREIQCHKAGLLREYLVEALFDLGLFCFIGGLFILFEHFVEVPYPGLRLFKGRALIIIEADKLPDGSFGVYSAKCV